MTGRDELFDAGARRAIREDLARTLVVEAAAGTGKTTEMIARIIAVIASGATTLERLVAVTFTEKAAGEMKLRLRTELEKARAAAIGDARVRLEAALAALEVARIGSIHSFCADLLRERPIEARVDPLFEVAAEDETERLYNQAFESWFQAAVASPPEGVRRFLRRTEPKEQLRKAGFALVDRRDFDGAWRRDPFDRAAAIDHVLRELHSLAGLFVKADKPDKDPARLFGKLQRWLAELDRREHVLPARDHDGIEAELSAVGRWWEWKNKGYGLMYGGNLARGDVIARRDEVKAALADFLDKANADLAACLHAELQPLVREYERLKARAGQLDFLDLLAKTRDLLRDDPRVRGEMQDRYTHFFIDEFQDTDPLQVEILLLLCADDPGIADPAHVTVRPGKLFVVGDPKQAIYRFRRADIALYEAVKARLVAAGATLLHLTTSFRAVPEIQTAINAAFEPVMQGDGQAHYVPLVRYRDDTRTQPAVIALPVPGPYGRRDIANTAIEESYPDAVAAFVHWLIERSGWTVADRGGARIPIDTHHVCLMFRRFQTFGRDLTRPYVKALEARSIAHVLVGGRSFHDREEIEAARNALRAIEWPDDEFSVYATLRGPLFSFHDEDLVAFRAKHRRLDPTRWADADATGDTVEGALAILCELHRRRNRRAIADTITRLLAATRAHAGIAIWPAGEQALANLLRVTDLARRFEAAGATSFRAFIDRLDTDAERGRSPDAPVVEEGTEGVRVMTVHKAKGLEFPIVILCDPTAPLAPSEPSHHVDPARRLWLERLAGCVPAELREHAEEVLRRDREEEQRLAYVAVTRARDLLVVPVVGDEEREGWLESLNPVVFPPPATKRAPANAPSCPPFGDDSVVERHHPDRMPHDSVAPGLHVPRAGTHAVVWWDPHVLELGVEPVGGLRQSEILQADVTNERAGASERQHDAWQDRRATALLQAGKASLTTQSVTNASRGAEPGGAPVAIAQTSIDRVNRPNGRRFGSLVHAVLAALDLQRPAADAAYLRAVAINQARLIDASPEEVDAAVLAVTAALAHPLMQRAAAAATLRREIPIVLDTPAVMLEGIIDLAFSEGTSWVVVDYKTDPELPAEVRAPYEAQVRTYAAAITAATGLPCAAALLLV